LYSRLITSAQTVREDIKEYLRRSPYSHAARIANALLIHTNTNDEDVNVLEVQQLIDSLKAAGKKFEYTDLRERTGRPPLQSHDTKMAKESRREVYRFLDSYLHPTMR